MQDLLARMVCTIETEECFSGKGDYCPAENLMNILIKNNIDLDDDCFWWALWK